jgi:hypothetical protein
MLNLLPNNEIIGKLLKITLKGLNVKLILTINNEIEVPTSAFSIKKLQSIVGKKIGIFYFEGKYFLREIAGE